MPFRIDDIWKLSTASIGQRLLAPDGQRRECCDTSMRESTQLQTFAMLKLRKYMLSNRIQREGQAEEGGVVNIIKEVYSCF